MYRDTITNTIEVTHIQTNLVVETNTVTSIVTETEEKLLTSTSTIAVTNTARLLEKRPSVVEITNTVFTIVPFTSPVVIEISTTQTEVNTSDFTTTDIIFYSSNILTTLTNNVVNTLTTHTTEYETMVLSTTETFEVTSTITSTVTEDTTKTYLRTQRETETVTSEYLTTNVVSHTSDIMKVETSTVILSTIVMSTAVASTVATSTSVLITTSTSITDKTSIIAETESYTTVIPVTSTTIFTTKLTDNLLTLQNSIATILTTKDITHIVVIESTILTTVPITSTRISTKDETVEYIHSITYVISPTDVITSHQTLVVTDTTTYQTNVPITTTLTSVVTSTNIHQCIIHSTIIVPMTTEVTSTHVKEITSTHVVSTIITGRTQLISTVLETLKTPEISKTTKTLKTIETQTSYTTSVITVKKVVEKIVPTNTTSIILQTITNDEMKTETISATSLVTKEVTVTTKIPETLTTIVPVTTSFTKTHCLTNIQNSTNIVILTNYFNETNELLVTETHVKNMPVTINIISTVITTDKTDKIITSTVTSFSVGTKIITQRGVVNYTVVVPRTYEITVTQSSSGGFPTTSSSIGFSNVTTILSTLTKKQEIVSNRGTTNSNREDIIGTTTETNIYLSSGKIQSSFTTNSLINTLSPISTTVGDTVSNNIINRSSQVTFPFTSSIIIGNPASVIIKSDSTLDTTVPEYVSQQYHGTVLVSSTRTVNTQVSLPSATFISNTHSSGSISTAKSIVSSLTYPTTSHEIITPTGSSNKFTITGFSAFIFSISSALILL